MAAWPWECLCVCQCEYVYMSVWVWMPMCVNVYVQVCMWVWMYMRKCTCEWVCVCACVWTRVCMNVYRSHVWVHVHASMRECMCKYIHMPMYMWVCECMCVSVLSVVYLFVVHACECMDRCACAYIQKRQQDVRHLSLSASALRQGPSLNQKLAFNYASRLGSFQDLYISTTKWLGYHSMHSHAWLLECWGTELRASHKADQAQALLPTEPSL